MIHNQPQQPIEPTSEDDPSVVIVGAGAVGSCMALELAKQQIPCRLLETRETNKITKPNTTENSFDGRSLALNLQSWQLLQDLLDDLPEHESIKQIRISQQGQFGSCLLDSQRLNLTRFGITLNSIELAQKLHLQLHKNESVECYFGIQNLQLELSHDQHVEGLTFEHQGHTKQLKPTLLIGADGSHSEVRQQLAIGYRLKDYQQTAHLFKLQHQRNHQGLAHERFLDQGILALLPTAELPLKPDPANDLTEPGYVSSVVLLQSQHHSSHLDNLNDQQLLQYIQQLFGDHYGQLSCLQQPQRYAMQEILPNQLHRGNSILIGNAAHSLHPVAGQGLNLGLRDSIELSNQLQQGGINTHSLAQFAKNQHHYIGIISHFVNGLLSLFEASFKGAKPLRSVGLKALDHSTLLQQLLCYYLCGLINLPKLTDLPQSDRLWQCLEKLSQAPSELGNLSQKLNPLNHNDLQSALEQLQQLLRSIKS